MVLKETKIVLWEKVTIFKASKISLMVMRIILSERKTKQQAIQTQPSVAKTQLSVILTQ